MQPIKKGTAEEVLSIKKLLQNDAFKLKSKYRITWKNMCTAAARDAHYHLNILASSLRRTKLPALTALQRAESTDETNCRLCVPSLAFVLVKIYKTLQIKLGKSGKGSLNVSHGADWAHSVESIEAHIADTQSAQVFQYLDPLQDYEPLSQSQALYIKKLKTGGRSDIDDDMGLLSDDDDIEMANDQPTSRQQHQSNTAAQAGEEDIRAELSNSE